MIAGVTDSAAAGWADASFAARLAAASSAVADLAAASDQVSTVADEDVSAVMAGLTTLVGQLDGLRVEVTRLVRERGLYRLRGAPNVAGWLRADARTADEAWKLARLSAMARELPKITGLLAQGTVSLSQAGAACWQVSQLPVVPSRPEELDTEPPADDPAHSCDEAWAGLWRGGDVQAAADELFAQFMPGMDSQQLRALGAHLREAADVQERAGEDYDDFARRSLRISRSLCGTGEISGRLHAEAAEQVISAFEELGAPTGPDDTRTKPQRWADVLSRLAGAGGIAPAEPQIADGDQAADSGQAAEGADDEPGPGAGHGHGVGHDHGPGHGDGAGHDHGVGHGHGADQDFGAGPGHETAESLVPPADGKPLPAGLARPRVIVMVPLATLLRGPLAPGAVLGSATAITGEAARRLACDAEVVRLVTDLAPAVAGIEDRRADTNATERLTDLLAGGIAQLPRPLGAPSAVLDIGRKSQGWTPRQRDALYAQYGGRCAAPRCTGPPEVIHHVVHWADGGMTSVANGLPFCQYDHWLVHEGGWRVSKRSDGAVVLVPPPRGWRPGTVYRRGKPVPETGPADADTSG